MATREVRAVDRQCRTNRRPAREDRAARDGGEAVSPRKPGNAGGGKGPWLKGDAGRSEGEEIGVSLRTPESVWKLQGALHAKAKGEPSYRFYSLYDKIHRGRTCSYTRGIAACKGGVCGVDGEVLSRSKRGGSKGGWGNWRRKSGRRPIGRRRCGGFGYKPMASNGLWEYQRLEIGSGDGCGHDIGTDL